MAERRFAKEVLKLRAHAGETVEAEGILTVTKALLESGVAYVSGHEGAPISHLMEMFFDGQDIKMRYADTGERLEEAIRGLGRASAVTQR